MVSAWAKTRINKPLNPLLPPGVVCSERKIKETIRKLDVHVDNLCQFLPQDKVCEFAQMTPQILLTETQHAAGEPEMTDWHQALIRIKHEKTAQEAVSLERNIYWSTDRWW